MTLPDWPVQLLPHPAWIRPRRPALYFIPYRCRPRSTGPPGGVQYIPTIPPDDPPSKQRLLRATNEQVIKQNYIVHHSAIGHHTQNWYAMQAASRIGQVAAVDGASRIAMLCGGTLAEGWASYTTDLMDEIGFLTPLESFAQQYAQLRMAARTVVDVRLHAGRFSPRRGAALLRGARRHVCRRVDGRRWSRTASSPATGCMYLAGWDGSSSAARHRDARGQRLLAAAVPQCTALIWRATSQADCRRDARSHAKRVTTMLRSRSRRLPAVSMICTQMKVARPVRKGGDGDRQDTAGMRGGVAR